MEITSDFQTFLQHLGPNFAPQVARPVAAGVSPWHPNAKKISVRNFCPAGFVESSFFLKLNERFSQKWS